MLAPLRAIVSGARSWSAYHPPQGDVIASAKVKPAGRVSLNATPRQSHGVSRWDWSDVKLRLVVPFEGIVEAPKDLAMVGGATTVDRVAGRIARSAVRGGDIAGCVGLVSSRNACHGHARMCSCQQLRSCRRSRQSYRCRGGQRASTTDVDVPLATVRPEGRVSLKATPVRATVFLLGLERVKVRVVVPFRGMLEAPKDLAIVGGATRIRVSVASSVFVAPWLSVSVPAGMVLI